MKTFNMAVRENTNRFFPSHRIGQNLCKEFVEKIGLQNVAPKLKDKGERVKIRGKKANIQRNQPSLEVRKIRGKNRSILKKNSSI